MTAPCRECGMTDSAQDIRDRVTAYTATWGELPGVTSIGGEGAGENREKLVRTLRKIAVKLQLEHGTRAGAA